MSRISLGLSEQGLESKESQEDGEELLGQEIRGSWLLGQETRGSWSPNEAARRSLFGQDPGVLEDLLGTVSLERIHHQTPGDQLLRRVGDLVPVRTVELKQS